MIIKNLNNDYAIKLNNINNAFEKKYWFSTDT